MLKRKPKEKERRKVAIPAELHDALQEAWYIVNESKRDPGVRVDYDDAIQVPPCLVGGKVGTKKRPFEFTYYVDGDRKTRWHLAFHPLELEDIADGHMTELRLYCCRTPDCGHKSNDPEFLCDCDYENDPFTGHIALADTAEALRRRGITGISDISTKADVIAVLGQPDASRDAERNTPAWIKYHRADCQLHFQFERSGKLKMLTVMEADWKPGF